MSGIVIDVAAKTSNAERDLAAINNSLKNIEKTTSKTASSFKAAFANIAITASAGIALKMLSNISSEFTNISNKVALVTGRTEKLAAAQKELYQISRETRSSIQNTVTSFSILSRSVKTTSGDYNRIYKATKAIQEAVAVSGASIESANAAITQLGQGLASGQLRGEELNSVLEQTPRIAKAIADELGVGVGQLRKLAEGGKLTSDVVFKALKNQAGAINKEFKQLTPTLDQAFAQINDSFKLLIFNLDTSLGVSKAFGKTLADWSAQIRKVADNTDAIASKIRNIIKVFNAVFKPIITSVKAFAILLSDAFIKIGFSRTLKGDLREAVRAIDKFSGGWISTFNVIKNYKFSDLFSIRSDVELAIRDIKRLSPKYWAAAGFDAKTVKKIFSTENLKAYGAAFQNLADALLGNTTGISRAINNTLIDIDFFFKSIQRYFGFRLDTIFVFRRGNIQGLLDTFAEIIRGISGASVKIYQFGKLVDVYLRDSFYNFKLAVEDAFIILLGNITKFVSVLTRTLIKAFQIMLDLIGQLGPALQVMADSINYAIDYIKDLFSELNNLNLFDKILSKIVDFGNKVKYVFFDIYDKVIGNSYWTDTIDAIINTSDSLWSKASKGLKKFANNTLKLFSNIYNNKDKFSFNLESFDKLKFGKNSIGLPKIKIESFSERFIETSQVIKARIITFFENLPEVLQPILTKAAALLILAMFSPMLVARGLVAAITYVLGKSLAFVFEDQLSKVMGESVFSRLAYQLGTVAGVFVNQILSDLPKLVSNLTTIISGFTRGFLSQLPIIGNGFKALFATLSTLNLEGPIGLLLSFFTGKALLPIIGLLGKPGKSIKEGITGAFSSVSDIVFGKDVKTNKKGKQVTPSGVLGIDNKYREGIIGQYLFGKLGVTRGLASVGLVLDYLGTFDKIFDNSKLAGVAKTGLLIYLFGAGDAGVTKIKDLFLTKVLVPFSDSIKNAASKLAGKSTILDQILFGSQGTVLGRLKQVTDKFIAEWIANIVTYSNNFIAPYLKSGATLLSTYLLGKDPAATIANIKSSFKSSLSNIISSAGTFAKNAGIKLESVLGKANIFSKITDFFQQRSAAKTKERRQWELAAARLYGSGFALLTPDAKRKIVNDLKAANLQAEIGKETTRIRADIVNKVGNEGLIGTMLTGTGTSGSKKFMRYAGIAALIGALAVAANSANAATMDQVASFRNETLLDRITSVLGEVGETISTVFNTNPILSWTAAITTLIGTLSIFSSKMRGLTAAGLGALFSTLKVPTLAAWRSGREASAKLKQENTLNNTAERIMNNSGGLFSSIFNRVSKKNEKDLIEEYLKESKAAGLDSDFLSQFYGFDINNLNAADSEQKRQLARDAARRRAANRPGYSLGTRNLAGSIAIGGAITAGASYSGMDLTSAAILGATIVPVVQAMAPNIVAAVGTYAATAFGAIFSATTGIIALTTAGIAAVGGFFYYWLFADKGFDQASEDLDFLLNKFRDPKNKITGLLEKDMAFLEKYGMAPGANINRFRQSDLNDLQKKALEDQYKKLEELFTKARTEEAIRGAGMITASTRSELASAIKDFESITENFSRIVPQQFKDMPKYLEGLRSKEERPRSRFERFTSGVNQAGLDLEFNTRIKALEARRGLYPEASRERARITKQIDDLMARRETFYNANYRGSTPALDKAIANSREIANYEEISSELSDRLLEAQKKVRDTAEAFDRYSKSGDFSYQTGIYGMGESFAVVDEEVFKRNLELSKLREQSEENILNTLLKQREAALENLNRQQEEIIQAEARNRAISKFQGEISQIASNFQAGNITFDSNIAIAESEADFARLKVLSAESKRLAEELLKTKDNAERNLKLNRVNVIQAEVSLITDKAQNQIRGIESQFSEAISKNNLGNFSELISSKSAKQNLLAYIESTAQARYRYENIDNIPASFSDTMIFGPGSTLFSNYATQDRELLARNSYISRELERDYALIDAIDNTKAALESEGFDYIKSIKKFGEQAALERYKVIKKLEKEVASLIKKGEPADLAAAFSKNLDIQKLKREFTEIQDIFSIISSASSQLSDIELLKISPKTFADLKVLSSSIKAVDSDIQNTTENTSKAEFDKILKRKIENTIKSFDLLFNKIPLTAAKVFSILDKYSSNSPLFFRNVSNETIATLNDLDKLNTAIENTASIATTPDEIRRLGEIRAAYTTLRRQGERSLPKTFGNAIETLGNTFSTKISEAVFLTLPKNTAKTLLSISAYYSDFLERLRENSADSGSALLKSELDALSDIVAKSDLVLSIRKIINDISNVTKTGISDQLDILEKAGYKISKETFRGFSPEERSKITQESLASDVLTGLSENPLVLKDQGLVDLLMEGYSTGISSVDILSRISERLESGLIQDPALAAAIQEFTAKADNTDLKSSIQDLKASIDALNASIQAELQTSSPISQNKANGGFIRGPGTGRSDSIPVNLSNGEFVVNSRDTAKNRYLLEMINNGMLPPYFKSDLQDKLDWLNNNTYDFTTRLDSLTGKPKQIMDRDTSAEFQRKRVAMGTALQLIQLAPFQMIGGGLNSATTILRSKDAVKAIQVLKTMAEFKRFKRLRVASEGLDTLGGMLQSLPYMQYLDHPLDEFKTKFIDLFGMETAPAYSDGGNVTASLSKQLARREAMKKLFATAAAVSANTLTGGSLSSQVSKTLVKDLIPAVQATSLATNNTLIQSSETLANKAVTRRAASQLFALQYKSLPKFALKYAPAALSGGNLGGLLGGPWGFAASTILPPLTDAAIRNYEDSWKQLAESKDMYEIAPLYANGGKIRGPGGPKDDKILARLSNGEFVVNAKSTKKYRGLLEQINNAPGFADGTPSRSLDFNLRNREAILEGNSLYSNIRRLEELNIDIPTGKLRSLSKRLQDSLFSAAREAFAAELNLAKAIRDNVNIEDAQKTFETASAKLGVVVEAVMVDLSEKIITAGNSFAESISSNLTDGLKDILKGKTEGNVLKGFARSFADTLTSSIIDTFVEGLMDPITGEQGIITNAMKSFGQSLWSSARNLFTNPEAERTQTPVTSTATLIHPQIPVTPSPQIPSATMPQIPGTPPIQTPQTQVAGLQSQFNMQAGITAGLTGITAAVASSGNKTATLISALLTAVMAIQTIVTAMKMQEAMSAMTGGAGGAGAGGSIMGFFKSMFGFADGGIIDGPGTSTSDSIPAMLSKGEFIVNAKASRKNLKLLSAINNGSLRRYSEGGLVDGNVMSVNSLGATSSQTININITGDISRQTRSEVLNMLPSIANGVNGYNKERGNKG